MSQHLHNRGTDRLLRALEADPCPHCNEPLEAWEAQVGRQGHDDEYRTGKRERGCISCGYQEDDDGNNNLRELEERDG